MEKVYRNITLAAVLTCNRFRNLLWCCVGWHSGCQIRGFAKSCRWLGLFRPIFESQKCGSPWGRGPLAWTTSVVQFCPRADGKPQYCPHVWQSLVSEGRAGDSTVRLDPHHRLSTDLDLVASAAAVGCWIPSPNWGVQVLRDHTFLRTRLPLSSSRPVLLLWATNVGWLRTILST